MIKIRRLDLLNLSANELAQIDEVLKNSSSATIFHSVEWNRLLIEEFGLQHVALLATNGSEPVGLYIYFKHATGFCQSPAISLQSVYGGPIAIDENPEYTLSLLKESERLQPIAHFQIWTPPKVEPTSFLQCGYQFKELHTPVLNLDCSEDELWLSFRRSKRRQIRKAITEGAVVEKTGIEDIDKYYEMVSDTLSKSDVTPLPLHFYRRVLDCLAPLGLAELYVVKLGQAVISGAIILYYNQTVYGWDLGWRREFSDISPNDLMNWEIAKKARQQGYGRYDLLRFEPDHLPGIATWKESFGGKIVSCYLFQKTTPLFRLFRPVRILFTEPSRAIRKMQLFLLNKTD